MKASGLSSGDSLNNPSGKHIHDYSTFDESLSYMNAMTHRFGEITPTFYMQGIPKDQINLNTKDHYDGLSLKAPFKGAIRRTKDTFMVPKMALLPFNWDLIYTQPSNGDDIPYLANTVIPEFPYTVRKFVNALLNNVAVQATGDNAVTNASNVANFTDFLSALFRALICAENFYSTGSLMNCLGYRLHHLFRYDVSKGFDEMFDDIIYTIREYIGGFTATYPDGTTSNRTFTYAFDAEAFPGATATQQEAAPFRLFLERARENVFSRPVTSFPKDADGNIVYDDWDAERGAECLEKIFKILTNTKISPETGNAVQFTDTIPGIQGDGSHSDPTADSPQIFNYEVLLAYQMICWHYYTNSNVDFMYTAELYRQYINSFYIGQGSGRGSMDTFTRNGYTLPYDFLSGRHIMPITFFGNSLSTQANVIEIPYKDIRGGVGMSAAKSSNIWRLAAIQAIFGFRKSLRYVDYFVGSRPRPLAPINTDVSVDTGKVSVIDITRNIQAQRFANAVMRSRQKIEDYVKDLFGKAPAPDFHNPFFLASQQDVIFGEEVQNTGDAQYTKEVSRTSLLNTDLSPYTFTFRNDDNHPCIYMQLVSYDVRRAYLYTKDRTYFVKDRFGMFNPDFQYIGDQPVYAEELGYASRANSIFGYQGRDMEYKQRFDVACGGFVRNLPGWIITDHQQYLASRMTESNLANLTPDFIRSWSYELDDIFLSLTGYSLGSYFHFAVVTMNNVSAKRAMAVDPQILA